METGLRSLLLYSTSGLRGFCCWAERKGPGWRRLANTKLVSLDARLDGSMTVFASGAVVEVYVLRFAVEVLAPVGVYGLRVVVVDGVVVEVSKLTTLGLREKAFDGLTVVIGAVVIGSGVVDEVVLALADTSFFVGRCDNGVGVTTLARGGTVLTVVLGASVTVEELTNVLIGRGVITRTVVDGASVDGFALKRGTSTLDLDTSTLLAVPLRCLSSSSFAFSIRLNSSG